MTGSFSNNQNSNLHNGSVISMDAFYTRSYSGIMAENEALSVRRNYWFRLFWERSASAKIPFKYALLILLEKLHLLPLDKYLEERMIYVNHDAFPDTFIEFDNFAYALQQLNEYILYFKKLRQSYVAHHLTMSWHRPLMKELYALKQALSEQLDEIGQEMQAQVKKPSRSGRWLRLIPVNQ